MYEIIILRVVLYGCETWSLTLRTENMVLRKISGPKRDEKEGECTVINFMISTVQPILFG